MKRLFDLSASLVGLLVLGWLVLVLALLVRRASAGPGIFAQTRVGRFGAPFTCYKLRTMYVATASGATHETPASAVTPLGRRLRALKLDELPQLWNVMKGEMSFVGPRPCLPIQERLVAERQARGVFAVRPGITGRAQVMGVDMADPERLAVIDADYVATRTFLGDLKLIVRTVLGGGRGDRVRLEAFGEQAAPPEGSPAHQAPAPSHPSTGSTPR